MHVKEIMIWEKICYSLSPNQWLETVIKYLSLISDSLTVILAGQSVIKDSQ